MPTQPRPPFASVPPEAPTMPATVQEPPASLGETATRLAVVGALLFAVPVWLAIVWGFAIWWGWLWGAIFIPLGLVVIGAGLFVFAAPLWDQFQAFRYKQMGRRQDYYHRGLITQTQVWLLRLHGLATYHRGPLVDPDAARIAGIPVYANGRRVWSSTKPYVEARYTETPTPARSGSSANPGPGAATLDDDYEPAESVEDAEGDTKQLAGDPSAQWTAPMIAIWSIHQNGIETSQRNCTRAGIGQTDWRESMQAFRRLGYVEPGGQGRGFRWVV